MPNDYATNILVKEAMPDADMGSTYDAVLDMLITRASRLIDGMFKRKPGAFSVDMDETRYYDGSGGIEQWIDELAAAPTSVSVAESGAITSYTAWASTDYFLWPANALLDGMPYMRLDIDRLYGTKVLLYRYPKSVKVVGKFGFSTSTPKEIEQATIIQTVRWITRGRQAYQDTGAILELGQLKYTLKLDPDVETLLSVARFQRLAV